VTIQNAEIFTVFSGQIFVRKSTPDPETSGGLVFGCAGLKVRADLRLVAK
jgi:hypothetical protein